MVNANCPGHYVWQGVQVPFEKTLHDVVETAAGPFAVGAHGTVLADRGNGWERVVEGGPTSKNNRLVAVDATGDGGRIWFAGANGVVGLYDIDAHRKYDHTRPERGDDWQALTVLGEPGSEQGMVADSSGEVVPFTAAGAGVNWGRAWTPAEGTRIVALDSAPPGKGVALDAAGHVHATTPDGWRDLGAPAGGTKLTDVYVTHDHVALVAGQDGYLYRGSVDDEQWVSIDVSDAPLRAIDVDACGGRRRTVVVDALGRVFEWTVEDSWTVARAQASSTLTEVALGRTDTVVGREGVVLEPVCQPGQPRRVAPKKGARWADGDSDPAMTDGTDDDGLEPLPPKLPTEPVWPNHAARAPPRNPAADDQLVEPEQPPAGETPPAGEESAAHEQPAGEEPPVERPPAEGPPAERPPSDPRQDSDSQGHPAADDSTAADDADD